MMVWLCNWSQQTNIYGDQFDSDSNGKIYPPTDTNDTFCF